MPSPTDRRSLQLPYALAALACWRMRNDRPALSANQPRIFHYTVAEHYNAIVQDGLIRPAPEGVPSAERPPACFPIHPTWEPTATKALRDRQTPNVPRD